jgi:hypothetical protein
MKFSAILLSAGFVAMVAAQGASTTASSAVPSYTPSPIIQCIEKCDDSDVTCKAQCIGEFYQALLSAT